MSFSRKLTLFLLAILVIPTLAVAETMYVSDQLIITMRRGKSNEHKILKTLKTGTPMEVLEREEGDSYVKVRLADGEEGYVLGQYLTSELPKAVVVSRLDKQVENLKEQLAEAKAKLSDSSRELKGAQETQSRKEAELTGSINDLNRALATAKQELRAATENYQTLVENSGQVVEITAERDRLKKANAELNSRVISLTAENTDLNRTGMIKWFLAGAGVLFFGWLIGKASQKKQRGLY